MIDHIRIRNFKSIRDVSVDLLPVTVLIGRSGVGKSNFLRAIRFLRNFLLRGNTAVELEGGWPKIYPFGVQADLSFDVRFRIPGYDERFEYYVAWSPGDNKVHHSPYFQYERLILGGKAIFERSANAWVTWPGQGKAGIDPSKSYLSSFPTITEAVLAYTAWTSGIGWHDFPANVFMQPAKGDGLFGSGGGDTSQSNGLDDRATNYLQVLREVTQNLRDQVPRRHLLARIKQINPSVAAIELDDVLQPKKVVVTHAVGDQRIPLDLSQESDGFRRYYAHLLALYQTPPKLLLMFEEPENGVYPGALRNLAEEFAAAAGDERGQVLLTTQSPDLLDGFEPDSLRVVEVDTHQATCIAPLDPAQLSAVRDQLLDPGELLTTTIARPAPAGTAQ